MRNKLKQEAQAVMEEAKRCLYCVEAPCASACPSGVRPGQFIRHLKCGDLKSAKKVIMDANSLGGVCGYVCPSEELCQSRCTREKIDRSVLIRELQKYVCDNAPYKAPRTARTGKKAAVVGAGPAGISCAAVLARSGVDVVVYDSSDEAGGLIASEIPGYRVPKTVLKRDIRESIGEGAEFALGESLEADDIKILCERYDAVFIAAGLAADRHTGIADGDISKHVLTSSEFLRRFGGENPGSVFGTVCVIGGGDSAVDVAETALRNGADRSIIVYRRSREEMPATDESLLEAVENGAEILYDTSLTGVQAGSPVNASFIQNKLGAPGNDGRRSFEAIQGSDFFMRCDLVVFALGKTEDEGIRDFCVKNSATRADSQETVSASKVFAGGDFVSGGATVVEAVRHGKSAAMMMLDYIGVPRPVK